MVRRRHASLLSLLPVVSHNFVSFNNISNMLRYLYEKPPHNNRKCGCSQSFVASGFVFQTWPTSLHRDNESYSKADSTSSVRSNFSKSRCRSPVSSWYGRVLVRDASRHSVQFSPERSTLPAAWYGRVLVRDASRHSVQFSPERSTLPAAWNGNWRDPLNCLENKYMLLAHLHAALITCL